MKTILVTGGCGFIGSHFISILDPKKYKVIIVDNLCNSDKSTIKKIKKINNIAIKFYDIDLKQKNKIFDIFRKNSIDIVVHFAGLKAVAESLNNPLDYFENNVTGSINLFQAMDVYDVKQIIFSSSATVYGLQIKQPVSEEQTTQPINPYGQTKLIIEKILFDLVKSDDKFKAIVLRYFNPIGAHKSGLLSESPKNMPNNLMPHIINVAAKLSKNLKVYGDDYKTPDGSGLRDYIHVMDLVDAHMSAIKNLRKLNGINYFNIGTGIPTSVFELIRVFEEVNNVKIPFKVTKRRIGDSAICYANPQLAKKKLNWSSRLNLHDACRDAWKAFRVITSNSL